MLVPETAFRMLPALKKGFYYLFSQSRLPTIMAHTTNNQMGITVPSVSNIFCYFRKLFPDLFHTTSVKLYTVI